ncbi:GTPase IMAP family member 8-like [Embiotoca jacksoni]|uniref:GTPase IMAP family member 8-like n=1 Tax=Embiotoca jacksoni TaxID=100190 RepID=UPI0037042DA3
MAPGPDSGPLPDLTVVLLGNSGVGKSASGNTILGHEAFESKTSFNSGKEISEKTGRVFGKRISVIDTPGILESKDLIEARCQDVLRSSTPHLFLLVVNLSRFTVEQKRAAEAAVAVVGVQGFSRCYLLFTCGDTLNNTSLQEFIFQDSKSSLPEFVRTFSGRIHLFDNKDGGKEQVGDLLLKSGHLQICEKTCSAGLRDETRVRRIVLIGPAGGGKSSSGNSLLGSRQFDLDCDFNGIRRRHRRGSAEVEGGRIAVVDSTGLTGQSLTLDQLAREIRTMMDLVDPGPHVFVFVVKVGRLSGDDSRLLGLLTRLFDGDVSKHTVVLFTHGDALGGLNLRDTIRSSSCVSKLVSRCGGRHCVIDNTRGGDGLQVRHFLRQVDDIIRDNGGRHCDSDDFSAPDGRNHGHPGQTIRNRLWISGYVHMWMSLSSVWRLRPLIHPLKIYCLNQTLFYLFITEQNLLNIKQRNSLKPENDLKD